MGESSYRLRVETLRGDRLAACVRGQMLDLAEPEEFGNANVAPTPNDLLVAGVASSVAHEARQLLRSRGWAGELEVTADWSLGEDGRAIDAIEVVVRTWGIPERLRRPMVRAARTCPTIRALGGTPAVRVRTVTEDLALGSRFSA